MAAAVINEVERLRWLAGNCSVPAVKELALSNGEAWLLMTHMPGKTAFRCLETEPRRGPEIVASIASFLRSLHSLPVDVCPFDSTHPRRLEEARARMEAGLVDTADFDDDNQGKSAVQVWSEMTGLLPLKTQRVFTHGDFSLDNILIEDHKVRGCIDVGRAGIADPYQDLAILWNCLAEFGVSLENQLLHDYGIRHIDQRLLRFHLSLDEFF